MLKIGDFSKLSRISIRMLRHYEEIGLLTPAAIDPFTGYRYYSTAQLPVVNRITALKEMGFSLARIGEVLRCHADRQVLAQCLSGQRQALQNQAAAVERRLQLVESALKRLEKGDQMMKYDVLLKEFPSRYVASVRQVIPSYYEEGRLWHILMQETAPLGLQDGDPCYAMAIFHDSEFKERDVDVEVQKTVRGSYADTEQVVFKTEPAVLAASATFKGSYDQINEVNEAVAQWVQDNGYEFDGLMFDIYHVSPHETDNPEEYITEVCYPVRKK